jgi:uncharacterized phage protein (TIGR01671 family)
MREIKFRAWDKTTNKMVFPERLFSDKDGLIWHADLGNRYSNIVIEKCNTAVLMQYTGLKDKNGKEIYEGDILSWQEHVRMYGTDLNKWVTEKVPVRFDDTGAMFLCGDDFLFKYNEKAEVIGNIYENQELLEVKRDEN